MTKSLQMRTPKQAFSQAAVLHSALAIKNPPLCSKRIEVGPGNCSTKINTWKNLVCRDTLEALPSLGEASYNNRTWSGKAGSLTVLTQTSPIKQSVCMESPHIQLGKVVLCKCPIKSHVLCDLRPWGLYHQLTSSLPFPVLSSLINCLHFF